MRGQHEQEPPRSWTASVATNTVGLIALFAFGASGVHAQANVGSTQSGPSVNFADDVASIIFENCTTCHREGGIGPMQFENYDQIRPWAPLIADKVIKREMPPYQYDTEVGVQELQHDWRLSGEEIETIRSWVEQGAPLGDPGDIPALELADLDAWNFTDRLGPPDLVIPSTPIDVPANGNDMWHRPYVATGLTEDRCIQAVQVKPAGNAKSVVHHANSSFQIQQEDGSFERAGRLTEYAMGKIGEVVPEGVCRVAPADSHILWDIHMYPGGIGATAPGEVIEDNVVEVGLWLHPEDYEAEYEQTLSLYGIDEGELVIPPHGKTVTQGFHTWDHPVRIDSFQPHGHLRMVAASLEIFHPDTGETELISMISNWSATWHHSHMYEPHVAPLVAPGDVVVLRQWYDNTADSPNNPDPDMWVDGGSRTADEMDHAWIAVTHLDDEGYDELLAEREALQELRGVTAGDE